MNKQEAIEKIEELKKYSCGALGDDWISLGIDKALNVVKQLDEPERPTLTEEEAEWIEGLKEEQERRPFWTKYSLLYFITRCGFGYGFSYDHEDREIELKHYPHEVHAEKERLANAILYGYEVEKEKLYTAMLLLTGEYLCLDSEGSLGHFKVDRDYILGGARAYQFTKHTLIKYKVWENDNYLIDEVEE